MNWHYRHISSLLVAGFLVLMSVDGRSQQITTEGDFRLRAYSDRFSDALDDRGTENYLRYLARVRTKAQVNRNASVFSELTVFSESSPVSPVRNIAGTGKMQYGISQLYAELVQPKFLVFDLFRARVGRQQFPLGEGLVQGESVEYFDKFDAIRFDMAYRAYTLSLFGAITEQTLSASGLYPDPGSDQLYIARLSRAFGNQTVMGYYVYDRLRGDFNDHYVVGGGASGNFMRNRLQYFAELAGQKFNTLSGLPDKGGIGYMAGISYRWAWGPFRSVKAETRYAAYQGNDATTEKTEIFSPAYPGFYWGSRAGYVDGAIGGDYPYNGFNPEGSRIWYSRLYLIPRQMKQVRFQIQYTAVSEYVNNDDYNTMDDELAMMVYYEVSPQARLQFRIAKNYPNGEDRDVNNSGAVTWSEDRVAKTRFMTELQVQF